MAYTATASDYTKTYTSFSGCDIVCTFGSVVIKKPVSAQSDLCVVADYWIIISTLLSELLETPKVD